MYVPGLLSGSPQLISLSLLISALRTLHLKVYIQEGFRSLLHSFGMKWGHAKVGLGYKCIGVVRQRSNSLFCCFWVVNFTGQHYEANYRHTVTQSRCPNLTDWPYWLPSSSPSEPSGKHGELEGTSALAGIGCSQWQYKHLHILNTLLMTYYPGRRDYMYILKLHTLQWIIETVTTVLWEKLSENPPLPKRIIMGWA